MLSRRITRIWIVLLFEGLVLGGLAVAQSGSAPGVSTILARMATARRENHARVRAYTVKRNYQLWDRQSRSKGQIVADITFLPPGPARYRIESGSGGLGETVLRDILIRETTGPSPEVHNDISLENYDIHLAGEETLNGRPCYVLALNPKRQEKELIRGKAWVDQADYNVVLLEGDAAKSPSWWIHDLHVLMTFANVDGMWLHTFTSAVANVRFKGKYAMVSRDLEYRGAGEIALK